MKRAMIVVMMVMGGCAPSIPRNVYDRPPDGTSFRDYATVSVRVENRVEGMLARADK